MGWTAEESVDSGQGKEVFLVLQRVPDWPWVPPSLLFSGCNAVTIFWLLKNLAELVDSPTACTYAASFCPSV
jgi:hypothetical protein